MPSYAFLWRTSDFSMEVGETATITLNYPNKGGDSISIWEDGVQIGTTTTNTYEYTPTSAGTHILHYFNTIECSPLTVTVTEGSIVSNNDTTTLNGALTELGETLAENLTNMGVTDADASDGLTTLASKILQIQTGGGVSNFVTGTFTTDSSGATSGTVNLNYNGNGYPIVALIFVNGGIYNSDTSWYTTVGQYDVGMALVIKANTNTTPTYTTSGTNNNGILSYIYKSSTSSATSYGWGGSKTVNAYTRSSTNATAGNSMIRFKGDGKTLSYYVGNRSSSTYGLARSTTFRYMIIYSQ